MNKSLRRPLIAGNWKMNMTPADTRRYARELLALMPEDCPVETALCVPAVDIAAAVESFEGSDVGVGAQNMHYEDKGAFTGELSAEMLTGAGAKYVIIGHSERRSYYNETDYDVGLKLHAALAAGLTPIVCIGESLRQWELGVTEQFLAYQLAAALTGVDDERAESMVVAYEPIWAIGTGRTATAEYAGHVCTMIRGLLAEKLDRESADKIRILYGGSMNGSNAAGLLAMEDIDGGLIGGASLRCADFMKIVDAARV